MDRKRRAPDARERGRGCRAPFVGYRSMVDSHSSYLVKHLLTNWPGLAHTCLRCCHITHNKCWRKLNEVRKHPITCATGCGCVCSASGGSFLADVLRRPSPTIVPPDMMSPGDYSMSSTTESASTSRLHSPEANTKNFEFGIPGGMFGGWGVRRG